MYLLLPFGKVILPEAIVLGEDKMMEVLQIGQIQLMEVLVLMPVVGALAFIHIRQTMELLAH